MIFIGYAGIGKSSLSAKNFKFIDLDSSDFYYAPKPDIYITEWYKPYCGIAVGLSRQGYDVFVSSHKEVRQLLRESFQHIVGIYPNEDLKDQWVEKLEQRYKETQIDKDYRAWMHAKDRYLEDIQGIRADVKHKIEIQTMQYNLDELIQAYQQRHSNDT